ncbi:MAG: ribosome biogenesis GTPase Der [Actinobacteria bacterium]|nr:MAG: ribosome biogenesis GTPase Der [Actinomycetota bacterium]
MSGRPLVAVVGRANVGKSTLVNRLLGRREAIEHPEPGVTRDRRAYDAEWDGVRFSIVDTGGWEPRARGLTAKVVEQAARAVREAQMILFVVDGETGPTNDDLAVARSLRKAEVPVVVVANKVDSAAREREIGALQRLGLGEAVPISALHGRGAGDLLDIVVTHVKGLQGEPGGRAEGAVAIAGRPNVGKSSLFNRLVGDERSIVHDVPGTTRDTVDTIAEIGGTRYRFVDTAGMRRRARDAKGPEYYGLVRSLRAIDESDVVLIVIDANEGAAEQDQKIAARVAESGRAAVIVLNKWDLVDADRADAIADDTREMLRFIPWAPIVRTSAPTKRGVIKIAPALDKALASWRKRVPTAALNAWLRDATELVPLGSTARARPTRIRYVTQAGTRPPTFVFFASGTITAPALRALERRLRERFGFEGTPLRLNVRKSGRRAV